MYGMNVHEAVYAFAKAQQEKNPSEKVKTGITIHKVTPEYDKGSFIFQESCEVKPEDTPESIAAKVHQLEHLHFPVVIEKLLKAQ